MPANIVLCALYWYYKVNPHQQKKQQNRLNMPIQDVKIMENCVFHKIELYYIEWCDFNDEKYKVCVKLHSTEHRSAESNEIYLPCQMCSTIQ